MTRNLKVLGLALAALAAMSVLAASASATNKWFKSESASTTLSGSQSTTNTFSTDSGTIHCTTATFSGTVSGTTVQEITVTPAYSGCKSTGFIQANVTVDVNDCHYQIRSHRTVLEDQQVVTKDADVVLSGCKAGTPGIVVTAPFCTITVPSGQTLSKLSFTNSGAGATREVTAKGEVTNINYNESGFACKNSGSSTTGGTYSGDVLVTGTSGGAHTGIWYE